MTAMPSPEPIWRIETSPVHRAACAALLQDAQAVIHDLGGDDRDGPFSVDGVTCDRAVRLAKFVEALLQDLKKE